jgi:hypothetical protein
MSNFLFLVSSAINTKFGVFDSEQRLTQTIATIQSIKQRVPAANICLIEMGAIELTQDQRQQLREHATAIVEFANDEAVQSLYHSTDNWDIVKNVTEVMCFSKCLKNLAPISKEFVTADRIFKISGRYTLNDKFDIDFYEDPSVKNMIVVGKRKNSQFGQMVTGGVDQQFMSRLWSWPKSQTEEISLVYDRSLINMGERIQQGGYIDIEHSLFKFLNHSKLVEKDTLGINGRIGPNGQAVED